MIVLIEKCLMICLCVVLFNLCLFVLGIWIRVFSVVNRLLGLVEDVISLYVLISFVEVLIGVMMYGRVYVIVLFMVFGNFLLWDMLYVMLSVVVILGMLC